MTPISWRPNGLAVDFLIDSSRHVFLQSVRPEGQDAVSYPAETEEQHSVPLAQVRLVGEGSIFGTSERIVYSATSARLQYVEHKEWVEQRDSKDVYFLEIVTRDATTELEVRSRYSVFGGIPGKNHLCISRHSVLL